MDPFEALADPVRRRLLVQLRGAPRTAGELAATEPISRPAVSRHLRVLHDSGLVHVDTVGRTRVYRLADSGLDPVTAFIDKLGHPAPPVPAGAFEALDLEVRRAVRDLGSQPEQENIA